MSALITEPTTTLDAWEEDSSRLGSTPRATPSLIDRATLTQESKDFAKTTRMSKNPRTTRSDSEISKKSNPTIQLL